MALGDPYVTRDELVEYMKLQSATVTAYSDLLDQVCESASREINRHCHRQFNQTTTATARRFVPDSGRLAYVDDFHTTTDLLVEVDTTGDGTFDTTWDSGDYQLEPLDGVVDGEDGWPFYKLRAIASRRFPCHSAGEVATLRVTAQWGWAAVPAPVTQAALILAAETFQLKDAPLGVAGADEFGTVLRVRDNKMAAAKVARYCRDRVLVG